MATLGGGLQNAIQSSKSAGGLNIIKGNTPTASDGTFGPTSTNTSAPTGINMKQYQDPISAFNTKIPSITQDLRSKGVTETDIPKILQEISNAKGLNNMKAPTIKAGATDWQEVKKGNIFQPFINSTSPNIGDDPNSFSNIIKSVPNKIVNPTLEQLQTSGKNIGQGTSKLVNNQGNTAENTLQVGQGLLSGGFSAFVPATTALFNTLSADETAGKVIDTGMKPLELGGHYINKVPGLSDFRDALPTEAKKQEFDAFVGNVVATVGTMGVVKTKEMYQKASAPMEANFDVSGEGAPKVNISENLKNKMFHTDEVGNVMKDANGQPITKELTGVSGFMQKMSNTAKGKQVTFNPNVETPAGNMEFKPYNPEVNAMNKSGVTTPNIEKTPVINPSSPDLNIQPTPKNSISNNNGVLANVKGKIGNFVTEQTTGLDKSKINGIQANPYTKEYSTDLQNRIKSPEGIPNIEQVQTEHYSKVSEDLQKAIEDKKKTLGEDSPVYNQIKELPTKVNIEPTISKFMDTLHKAGIVYSNGEFKTDGGMKSANFTPTDISNVNKFVKSFESETNNGQTSPAKILEARKLATLFSKFDATKTSEGMAIFRDLRRDINSTARPQIAGLSELDKNYADKLDQLQQAQDFLVYKGGDKKGQFKSNFNSIIKNIWNDRNTALRERLQEVKPDLEARVEAINQLKTVHGALTKENKLFKYATGGAGAVGGFFTGGPIGAVKGYIAGTMIEKGTNIIKNKQIDKIINTISPEGKARLEGINQKIKDNQNLSIEDKKIIEDIKNKVSSNIKQLPKASGKPTINTINTINVPPKGFNPSEITPKSIIRKPTTIEKPIIPEKPKLLNPPKLPKGTTYGSKEGLIVQQSKKELQNAKISTTASKEGMLSQVKDIIKNTPNTLKNNKTGGIGKVPTKIGSIIESPNKPLISGVKKGLSPKVIEKNPLIEEAKKYKSADEFNPFEFNKTEIRNSDDRVLKNPDNWAEGKILKTNKIDNKIIENFKKSKNFKNDLGELLYKLNKKAKAFGRKSVYEDYGPNDTGVQKQLYDIKDNIIKKYGKETGEWHSFEGGGIGKMFKVGDNEFHIMNNNLGYLIETNKNFKTNFNLLKNKLDDIGLNTNKLTLAKEDYGDGYDLYAITKEGYGEKIFTFKHPEIAKIKETVVNEYKKGLKEINNFKKISPPRISEKGILNQGELDILNKISNDIYNQAHNK